MRNNLLKNNKNIMVFNKNNFRFFPELVYKTYYNNQLNDKTYLNNLFMEYNKKHNILDRQYNEHLIGVELRIMINQHKKSFKNTFKDYNFIRHFTTNLHNYFNLIPFLNNYFYEGITKDLLLQKEGFTKVGLDKYNYDLIEEDSFYEYIMKTILRTYDDNNKYYVKVDTFLHFRQLFT
jgi:hypothetical protein